MNTTGENEPIIAALAKAIYEAWALEVHADNATYMENRLWDRVGEVQRERAYVQAKAALKCVREFDATNK